MVKDRPILTTDEEENKVTNEKKKSTNFLAFSHNILIVLAIFVMILRRVVYKKVIHLKNDRSVVILFSHAGNTPKKPLNRNNFTLCNVLKQTQDATSLTSGKPLPFSSIPVSI